MLRCIAACELPREPRQVCVLHHDIEGLIISAVRYNPHALIDPESNALCYPPPAEEYSAENNNNVDEEDGTANYFTIVETAIPLTAAQPESFATTAYAADTTTAQIAPVRILTVPVPGVAIHALTLLHREGGREVYVMVQCAVEKEGQGKDGGALGFDTAAYVFRRVLMHSSSEEDEDEDDDDEGDNKKADGHGATAGIRYVRMPRLVDDEHRTWTALTTLDTDLLPSAADQTDNSDKNKSTSTTLGSASQASSQASTSAAAVVVVAAAQARASGETALQVFAVSATRAERYATCCLPSLTGLQVTQLLPRLGLPRHLLLLCPHLIAEVELRMRHNEGHTHVMAVPTRVWRCGPQDVLLACALKEHYLYAGTAEGTLLLWDTRLASQGGGNNNNNKCNNKVEMNEEEEEDNDEANEGVGCMARARKAALDEAGALIGAGEASTTAITGLHAVYATEFYTCAMDGAMRGWRYVQEGSLNDGFTTARQGQDASPAQAVEHMLGDTAAFVPVLEAEADMRVMYAGLNAAVSMAGVEHYMAVVHEEGQMRVYMSA